MMSIADIKNNPLVSRFMGIITQAKTVKETKKAIGIIDAKEIVDALFSEAAQGNQSAQETLAKIGAQIKQKEIVENIETQAKLANIDYAECKEKYISDKKSDATKKTYRRAFTQFEAFCSENKIDPLQLTAAQADDFTRNQKEKYAPNSALVTVSAISGFYAFLIRESNGAIESNPFTGSRVKPQKKVVQKCKYPSESEVKTIIQYLREHSETPALAQIATLCAYDGFRIGAFQNMTISERGIATTTKGKLIRKHLSKESLAALEGARGRVFEGVKSAQRRIAHHIEQAYKKGLIADAYSAQDLRHFYAVRLYKATKDIKAVQKAFNHSSVAITDIYLRELDLIDD